MAQVDHADGFPIRVVLLVVICEFDIFFWFIRKIDQIILYALNEY